LLHLEVDFGIVEPLDDLVVDGFPLFEEEVVVARRDGPEVDSEEEEEPEDPFHAFVLLRVGV